MRRMVENGGQERSLSGRLRYKKCGRTRLRCIKRSQIERTAFFALFQSHQTNLGLLAVRVSQFERGRHCNVGRRSGQQPRRWHGPHSKKCYFSTGQRTSHFERKVKAFGRKAPTKNYRSCIPTDPCDCLYLFTFLFFLFFFQHRPVGPFFETPERFELSNYQSQGTRKRTKKIDSRKGRF